MFSQDPRAVHGQREQHPRFADEHLSAVQRGVLGLPELRLLAVVVASGFSPAHRQLQSAVARER